MRPQILVLVAVVAGLLVSPAGASTVEIHLPLQVCELILKDAKLVEYFHVDVPGKTPIAVDSTFLHPDFSARQLDYPIKIVSGSRSGAVDTFRITRVDSTPDRIVIEFEYPVEGLRGRFTFAQRQGEWVIRKQKLWEV